MPSPSPPPSTRGHWVGLEYHGRLLADIHRMDAYERAIRALVRPGDVVLDLGAGTGVLAMLAARRGAARVYAVESTPVADMARELVRANALEGQVFVHQVDFVTLAPPEPVDLVISDFLGRFLVDDQMLEAVSAARAWLKPEGRFSPSSVALWTAPAGNFLFTALDPFRYPVYGLDFRLAHRAAMNRSYGGTLLPSALLASPARFAEFEPASTEEPVFDRSLAFELTKTGELTALAGWFRAELAPGVTLGTEPGIQSHWGQYLFPLPPVAVDPGDRLEVHLRLLSAVPEVRWQWSGAIRRGADVLATFDHREEENDG